MPFEAITSKTATLGQKKKIVMLPSRDHNLKIGSVGRDFFIFYFFIFFFTYRERVEFSNIFLKVSKWGKLGQNAVKNLTLFFRILRSVGRGQHKHFFFWP